MDRCTERVIEHGRGGNVHQCSNPAKGYDEKSGAPRCGVHLRAATGRRVWKVVTRSWAPASEPELVSAPVVKETEKQVTIDSDGRGYEFGATRLDRSSCDFDREAAIARFAASQRAALAVAEEKVSACRANIDWCARPLPEVE